MTGRTISGLMFGRRLRSAISCIDKYNVNTTISNSGHEKKPERKTYADKEMNAEISNVHIVTRHS